MAHFIIFVPFCCTIQTQKSRFLNKNKTNKQKGTFYVLTEPKSSKNNCGLIFQKKLNCVKFQAEISMGSIS